MLQFAATAFLWGGALIAVPVVLHLMRRRLSEKISFPSFFFLKSIDTAAMQHRNSIRKWLILLLRVLTIAALGTAFALPFIPELPSRIGEARVILIDASMSMRAVGAAAVTDAALKQLKALKHDTVAVVGMVGDTTIWSGGFAAGNTGLEPFIRTHMLSDTVSDYDQALRQADAMLKRLEVKKKSVVLLTDMQKLPWQGVKINVPLAPEVGFEVIAVPARWRESIDNLWIENTTVETYDAVYERMKAAVTVVNGGSAQATATLKVTAGGSTGSLPIILAPLEKSVFQVELKDLKTEISPLFGIAELTASDVLKADNFYYFPIVAQSRPEVLITSPDNGTVDFVRAALNPDNATACAALKYIDRSTPEEVLNNAGMVILRDAAALTAGQLTALKRAVRNGGAVVIAWDRTAMMKTAMREFGIEVIRAESDSGKTLTFSDIDFELPPFRKFAEERAAGLYEIAFSLTAKLKLPDSARVLASFGPDQPAVAEFPCGKGTVFVLAFCPDRTGTDWPTRANFLPFWHELVKQVKVREKASDRIAASFRPVPLSRVTAVKRLDDEVLVPPIRNGRFIPARSGVYRLESAAGSKTVYVNHAPAESATCYMQPGFNPSVAAKTSGNAPTVVAATAVPANGRQLFMFFLVLALLCGCGELLLSNRTAL